jgi:sec-independent protein translocase protein TatC
MLLTPPDIISQTLLALPMWVLFEIGLVFSRLVMRERKRREEAGDEPAMAVATAASSTAAAGETETPSDQEMEDEFDRIEREFDAMDAPSEGDGPVADEAAQDHKAREDAAETAEASPDESADMLDEEVEFPSRTATEALVDAKLQHIAALRGTGADDEVRRMLYEVLADGNETQVKVARNILDQLDS